MISTQQKKLYKRDNNPYALLKAINMNTKKTNRKYLPRIRKKNYKSLPITIIFYITIFFSILFHKSFIT